MDDSVQQYNSETQRWEPAIPLPYYWGFFPWVWKRVTGWRDGYNRPAQLFLPWK